MPAQDGLGLDNQQSLAPGAQATGEQGQERPVRRGAAGAFDAALQDDDLVAEEGIFHQQLGLTPCQIGRGSDDEGRGSRLGDGAEPPVKAASEGMRGGRQAVDEAGHQGRCLLEQ